MTEVRPLFQRYHGYGDTGGASTECFGWFESGRMVAAFVWQPPAHGAAKSVCPEAPQGVLALSRMVAVPRAEREMQRLSLLLRHQFQVIDRTRWPVLVTYSDEGQGHNGWVYRRARMKRTQRRCAKVYVDANGVRRSSLSNGRTDTGGLTRCEDTFINRWEHRICPAGKTDHWMRWHGWVKEPIPGKTWASGKQAHRYRRLTDMPSIHPGPMGCSSPQVPVRDASGTRLPVDVIRAYMIVALGYAAARPDQLFHVQRDGWGYSIRDLEKTIRQHAAGNVMVPWELVC